MSHSEFTVIKGTPLCIAQGLIGMDKSGDIVTRKIKTNEYTKARKMKLVTIEQFDLATNEYEPMGRYYADVVTGSLYHPVTGKCLSSDQISLVV